MFEIPEWENDIPKSNFNVTKIKLRSPGFPKMNKNGDTVDTNASHKVVQKKVSNVNSIKEPPQKIENNKKAKKRKLNADKNKLDIQNLDADKIDEAILDAGRKKFNEALERDDDEDDLFKDEGSPRKQSKLEPKTKPNAEIQQSKVSHKKQVNKIVKQDVNKNLIKSSNKNVQNSNGNLIKSDKENETSPIINNHVKNGRTTTDRKKDKLKKVLESNRTKITVNSNKLRNKMMERLKAAQFRFLNEKLYTSNDEAKQLFQSDPASFHTYHEGYQQQIKKWPVNPLNVIVKRIKNMPKTHTIVDMGCGEAALSRRVKQTVRSFDLVAASEAVEVCDIAHTPLTAASMDVAVYCLALMGTELTQYLVEANRVLKMSGHLLIAEVESRFDNVDNFVKEVQSLGFKLIKLDKSNKVFFFMEFIKEREPPAKKSKLPAMALKPCLYKKR